MFYCSYYFLEELLINLIKQETRGRHSAHVTKNLYTFIFVIIMHYTVYNGASQFHMESSLYERELQRESDNEEEMKEELLLERQRLLE